MWLLCLMILIMPYEANPYLYIAPNFLGIFPDFTVIKLLGLVGFAWAGARLVRGHPHMVLLRARPARMFLLFFFGVLFAGLFSGSGFLAISRYFAFLTFLPIVLVSVQTPRDLERVLKVMTLTLILVFPYAVRQMIRFNDRLGVGLYETNYFATILVLVIPLAFVFAAQATRRSQRRWWLLGGMLLVLELFLTSSRGGFVGLLVAGMVFVYRKRGAMGAAAVIAVLLLALIIVPTDLGSRLWSVFDSDAPKVAGLDASNKAHSALFWAALRMIGDNPLFGVGPLNFKKLSTAYTGLEQGNIAHNSFLEVAAEFGLPIFVIFVMLLASVFSILNRAARLRASPEGARIAGWAEGLRSGLTGFLVAGCFISAQYEKMLWLAVFSTIVLGHFAAQARAMEISEAAEEEGLTFQPLPEPTQ
jgi:O-antigen ligase